MQTLPPPIPRRGVQDAHLVAVVELGPRGNLRPEQDALDLALEHDWDGAESRSLVSTSRKNFPPVRAERGVHDASPMSLSKANGSPRARIPELDLAVGAACQGREPIGAEGHNSDPGIMP